MTRAGALGIGMHVLRGLSSFRRLVTCYERKSLMLRSEPLYISSPACWAKLRTL